MTDPMTEGHRLQMGKKDELNQILHGRERMTRRWGEGDKKVQAFSAVQQTNRQKREGRVRGEEEGEDCAMKNSRRTSMK